MTAEDRERWQARWHARPDPPGEPEPFLVRMLPSLPKGRVLDVAAGAGRNALWLAAQGREVTAIDIAPAAIQRLEKAAAAHGLRVTTRVADLDEPSELTRLGRFAALVVVRYRPPAAQWRSLLSLLEPSGRLLLCSFATAQHNRHGFPRTFCLDRDELESELALTLRLLDWREWTEGSDHLAGSIWERTLVQVELEDQGSTLSH